VAKKSKVIITCAVTGSIHTPSMSPHLPITSQQIADAAIGAAEAGAAVVHLHARNPQDGRPDQTPEAFAPFLKVIKQRSNVVVNITTGGSPTIVMPLVFGGAPLINVISTMIMHPPKTAPSPMFYAGVLMAAAGAGMVLYYRPAP